MSTISTGDLCHGRIADSHPATLHIIAGAGRCVQTRLPPGPQRDPDCLSIVCQALAEIDSALDRAAQRKEEQAREQRKRYPARDFLKQTSPREREHLILGLFAEGARLTKSEALRALRDAHPE